MGNKTRQTIFKIHLRGRVTLCLGAVFLAGLCFTAPLSGPAMERKYDISIWMPLYCDQFLSETENMSPAETQAYIRILVRLWKAGGYLPANPKYLQKVSGLSRYNFLKVWQKIEKLFENNSQNIFKTLMLKEIEKARKNKESASIKGKKGAAARWKTDAPANTPRDSPPGNGSGNGNFTAGIEGLY